MRRGRESIARAALRPALALVVAGAGCAGPPAAETPAATRDAGSLAAALRAQDAAPPGALVVRLAFGAGADLDLYVSDPLLETVYFANTPTAAGGALDADRACDDAPPRVETVVFARPPRGRYRIGVDHHEPCRGADAALFAVRAERDGRIWQATGELAPRRFEPIVLEFEIAE
jgi:hypothetical protein